jgi:3D (Asp-Asp-Asp) domain-containing protein
MRPRGALVCIVAAMSAACGSSTHSSPDASAIDAANRGSAMDAAPIDAEGEGVEGGSMAGPTLDAGKDADPDEGGAVDARAVDAAGEGGTTYTMEVTFYGWADNSPPGSAIAYPMNGGFPTVHDAAGGTGTFADPITFATDQAEIPVGTIVYIPFIEKYLVMEDDCTECDEDWTSKMTRHVDVWMNSNGTDNVTDLTNCEDQWTQSAASVQVNPAAGLPVTVAPLFDPSTNTCRTTP